MGWGMAAVALFAIGPSRQPADDLQAQNGARGG